MNYQRQKLSKVVTAVLIEGDSRRLVGDRNFLVQHVELRELFQLNGKCSRCVAL